MWLDYTSRLDDNTLSVAERLKLSVPCLLQRVHVMTKKEAISSINKKVMCIEDSGNVLKNGEMYTVLIFCEKYVDYHKNESDNGVIVTNVNGNTQQPYYPYVWDISRFELTN